jgi:hypothetical protein
VIAYLLAVIPPVHMGHQSQSNGGEFPWELGPGAGPKLLALLALGLLVICYWRSHRPCDTCGEFRQQCRCKPREY